MANFPPIQFKRSNTPGAVPGDSDLAVGELAINLVDKKLFTKNGSGVIVDLGRFDEYDSELSKITHDYKAADSDIRDNLIGDVDSDLAQLRHDFRSADSDIYSAFLQIVDHESDLATVVHNYRAADSDLRVVLKSAADHDSDLDVIRHNFLAADSDLRATSLEDVRLLMENDSDQQIAIDNLDSDILQLRNDFESADSDIRLKLSTESSIAEVLAVSRAATKPILIPTGNPNDVITVGTGGEFASIGDALDSPRSKSGTILRLVSNITVSTQTNVTKSVVIDLDGFTIDSTTSDPVIMFNITAPLAVMKNGNVTHLKTTNTSIESVFTINGIGAPVFLSNLEIGVQEFGAYLNGGFVVVDCHLKYVGASQTNSHRYFRINNTSGECRIQNNTFECIPVASGTRYTNFISMSASTPLQFSGKLFISNNVQTSGQLRQFFLHEAGTTNGLEIYFANNVFNDFNGGIGIISPALYNSYSKIGVFNNQQGDDAVGNFKGVFFVDGSGAISDTVEFLHGGNTTTAGPLRVDYTTMVVGSDNLIARRLTTTQTALIAEITQSQSLEELTAYIDEISVPRIRVVDQSGSDIQGTGVSYDPFVIPPLGEISTLSNVSNATPAHGNTLVWDSDSELWKPGLQSTVGSINDLSDVDTTTVTPAHGNTLVWDSDSELWKPGVPEAVSRVSELLDVDLTELKDGMTLSWDSDSELWKPSLNATSVQIVDQFTATQGQTDFTLSKKPNSDIAFYRNGVFINKNATIDSEGVVIYDPTNNNNQVIQSGDRINIQYTSTTVFVPATTLNSITFQDLSGPVDGGGAAG